MRHSCYITLQMHCDIDVKHLSDVLSYCKLCKSKTKLIPLLVVWVIKRLYQQKQKHVFIAVIHTIFTFHILQISICLCYNMLAKVFDYSWQKQGCITNSV